MGEPLRLVFMGSDAVALPLLDWLAGEGRASATLVGIFTGPDRPSGRGQAVNPNAVKAWAAGRAAALFQPEKLDAAFLPSLAGLRADVALVVAYGQILRDEFIGAPRLGTLNLHASLLPAYRGASPIQAAVAAGDRETGVALMRIIRELDAGPVADVERVPIGPLDTAGDVEARLAAAGGAPGAPGTVVGADPDGLLVAAGSGCLRLRRLQRAGGRMLAAPEFLRGFPIPAGTVIASLPMPPLVSPAPFRR